MTTQLAKGQNIPLGVGTLVLRVTAGIPCDISALLLGPAGRVRSDADFVFYNQPSAAGVTWNDGTIQSIRVDLAAVSAASLICVVSVDPGAEPLGAVAAPVAVVTAPDGSALAEFTIGGLTTERAVIAWEVYRRAGVWKLRAVGQGYDGGLARAVTEHGVALDDPAPMSPPATTVATPSVSTPPAAPAVPPPPGTSEAERLHRHVIGIFEDAARSAVGLRSALSFAESRRDQELSEALADPSMRHSPAGDSARATAERRYGELAERARADHRRDITQLSTELAQLQPKLPAAMSEWTGPAWQQWSPPVAPGVAVRVGDLHLPEAPEFRMPMLVGLPLGRPLWIDTGGAFGPSVPDSVEALLDASSGGTTRVAWRQMLRALVVRLLAANPIGTMTVLMADLTGRGSAADLLAPLGSGTGGVLQTPVATTPADLSTLLTTLVERVDLIHMARRAGSLDALGGRIDDRERLLVLTDFPYGFDEAAIAKVRFLMEEGPRAGVQLIVIGSHTDVQGHGPLVGSMFRAFLRLPVEPDDHLGDGWTGTSWTFTPDAGPAEPVLDGLLDRLAAQPPRSPQFPR